MRTISQAVEEIIQRSPFLAEAMTEGIANNAQIARKILPDVERRLYEKVSEAAIAMALHRMRKKTFCAPNSEKLLKQINDITVRSNLVELVCPSSEDISGLLETISKGARRRKDTFVNFSRGLHESLLILDGVSARDVGAVLSRHKIIRRNDSVSAITLRLPEQSLEVPGLYYPVLKALANEGISFIEIVSIRTELSILFKDADVDRAFSVLKRITS